jgi:hypothetical protein
VAFRAFDIGVAAGLKQSALPLADEAQGEQNADAHRSRGGFGNIDQIEGDGVVTAGNTFRDMEPSGSISSVPARAAGRIGVVKSGSYNNREKRVPARPLAGR